MEQEIIYYELRESVNVPGKSFVRAGTRMTKEEWLALDLGFKDDDFNLYHSWFRPHTERIPDYGICTSIVCELLELPSSCRPDSLSELEQSLRKMESEASDVSKAYGLRCAADLIKVRIEKRKDPTREEIMDMVKKQFNRLQK